MDLTVYHGDERIAGIGPEGFWVKDDMAGDCRLVLALVQLGIPVDRTTENTYDFWRVQVQDPDFAEALKEHLEVKNSPFGLTVAVGETSLKPEES